MNNCLANLIVLMDSEVSYSEKTLDKFKNNIIRDELIDSNSRLHNSLADDVSAFCTLFAGEQAQLDNFVEHLEKEELYALKSSATIEGFTDEELMLELFKRMNSVKVLNLMNACNRKVADGNHDLTPLEVADYFTGIGEYDKLCEWLADDIGTRGIVEMFRPGDILDEIDDNDIRDYVINCCDVEDFVDIEWRSW